MSENEKMPTDAGAPAETTAAEQTRCWRHPSRDGNGKRDPAAAEPSAAEQRGEAIGEHLAALEAEEKAAAATPEGAKADRKKHVGVIVAAVVFAVLLIGAGVAYSVLAPAADSSR